jgi:DNA-binding LytR/AlgR family response regulator
MSKKILIVENNLMTAQTWRLLLENEGYEITDCVVDSHAAIQSILSNPPHLILLDYELDNDTKGTEVSIFAKKFYPIPIIYLTELRDKETTQAIRNTTAEIYVNKPITNDLLISNINSALNKLEQIKLIEAFKQEQIISIKSKHEPYSIKLKDILWFSTKPHTRGSFITTIQKEDHFRFYQSLKKILNAYPIPTLIKINSHTIVNLRHIYQFTSKDTFIIPELFQPKSHLQSSYREFTISRRIPSSPIFSQWKASRNFEKL